MMPRRAFTLLETVLAASLAGVVAVGCIGAFFALERTDKALSVRFEEANDLARIQRTMQRAFTTFQLSEEPFNETEEEGLEGEEQGTLEGEEGGEEEADEAEAGDEQAGAETIKLPRLLLEPDTDPTLTSLISSARLGGGGGPVAVPQRLEVVLSSVPIRPPTVQSTVWANALVGVEDLEAEEAAEAAGVEDYDGVRGAFVLRPDDPTLRAAAARTARGDDRVGWTLWWQPLDDRSEPARVASGLAACNFQMFREREMVTELVGANAEELPTYIQLEVETLSGLYANYLFEVVWTVDVEDESASATSGAGGAGGDGGQGGNQAQNDQFGGGPGGGRRGGGRPQDGEQSGRPKPLTPQSAPPGRRLDRPGVRPGQAPGGGGRGGDGR